VGERGGRGGGAPAHSEGSSEGEPVADAGGGAAEGQEQGGGGGDGQGHGGEGGQRRAEDCDRDVLCLGVREFDVVHAAHLPQPCHLNARHARRAGVRVVPGAGYMRRRAGGGGGGCAGGGRTCRPCRGARG
jgi:hypothetical protein